MTSSNRGRLLGHIFVYRFDNVKLWLSVYIVWRCSEDWRLKTRSDQHVNCWSDQRVNCWSDQHMNCWSSQLFVSWHPRSEGFIWRTFLSQIWLFMEDINSYKSGIDLIEDLKLISWFVASLSIYIETFISWMLMICIVFSRSVFWV